MADPLAPPTSSTSSASSGFSWRKLTSRQRKMIVAAVAVLAGLFVLLRGRGSASPSDVTATDAASASPDAVDSASVDPNAFSDAAPGTTFADNGAAAGALSSAVTDSLGNLSRRVSNLSHQDRREVAILRNIEHDLNRHGGQQVGGGHGRRHGGGGNKPGGGNRYGGGNKPGGHHRHHPHH